MPNLVEVIKILNRQICDKENKYREEQKKLEQKYQEEIQKLQQALEVNLELNDTCLECEGRKWVYTVGASGHNERERCPVCNGTGEFNRNKYNFEVNSYTYKPYSD